MESTKHINFKMLELFVILECISVMACFEAVLDSRVWWSFSPIDKIKGDPFCLNKYIFQHFKDIIHVLHKYIFFQYFRDIIQALPPFHISYINHFLIEIIMCTKLSCIQQALPPKLYVRVDLMH